MSGKVVDQSKHLSKMERIQMMFRMLKHLLKRRFRNQYWKQSILVSEYFEAVSWKKRYRNLRFKMELFWNLVYTWRRSTQKIEVCPGSVAGTFRTRKLNFSNLQLRKSSEVEASSSDPKKASKKPLTKKPSKSLQNPSFAAKVEKLEKSEKDLQPTPGALATRDGAKGRLGGNKKNMAMVILLQQQKSWFTGVNFIHFSWLFFVPLVESNLTFPTSKVHVKNM